MGLSIEEILEKATPRVEEARVCIDGRLLGEHSRLTAELELLQRSSGDKKMAGSGPSAEAKSVAQRVVDLEAEIEKAKVTFTFAGIGPSAQAEIMRRFPAKSLSGWDLEKGAAAFIAACSAEPKMSEEQAGRLCDKIGSGGTTELFNAAWKAANEATNVDPSERASALIGDSGSK